MDPHFSLPAGVVACGYASSRIELQPTNTRPGTSARIEVYRRRVELGLPLFVAGDYVDPEFFKRGKICYHVSPPANG